MIYRTLLFFFLFFIILKGDEIKSLPSFQGFDGVVNTPNSEVLPEGKFEFLYTNQIDNFFPSSSIDFRDNREQSNYFLNMGLLPNLDVSLRYSYAIHKPTGKAYLSDRIINFKYQVPFIPKDIVKLSFGMQDIGGKAQHLSSKYAVLSKNFDTLRTSIGYAKGNYEGSLDGIFGSMEYQPLSWLQIAGEYDTKEWNGVVKTNYSTTIANKRVNIGVMAKSSLEYNDIYWGFYGNVLFKDIDTSSSSLIKTAPISIEELKNYGFSNISYRVENNILFFSYENTLYTYNDIDALGIVLGTLVKIDKASTIIIDIKKSNIVQYRVKVNTKEYKEFLKTGIHQDGLLSFIDTKDNSTFYHSDQFKPTLTIQPDFILVDGSEYGHMDYTLAMQTELSMRLAKGTLFSARYNLPLSISDNFKQHGIFDYRNREKTTASFDQILLSQFFQMDLPYRWINLIQVGKFDNELLGASLESEISDLSGRHSLLLKISSLEDKIYNYMDLYLDKNREERLLSYRYYSDMLNSNIKITAGDFLYGDRGIDISLKRYFSDTILNLEVAHTTHKFKGTHNVGKLTLSIPFGGNKSFKTDYIDIKGNYLNYERRKTLVVSKNQLNVSQPHHLKEINNNFTLENYYLNRDRFHPTYIQNNIARLRAVFLTSSKL